MDDAVHVAFAVDGKFIDPVAVAISSIVATAADPGRLRIHLLYERADTSVPERIAQWELPVPLDVVPIDNPFPESTGRITTAALYRTLLPSVLPELDRVLYLDADTLLLRDVAQLYSSNLDGAAIAGVIDAGMYLTMDRGSVRGYSDLRDYFVSLGFDPERRHYINSGVLVMDLDALRRLDFLSEIKQTATAYQGQLRTRDQCLINMALRDHLTVLDPRWNVLSNVVGRQRWHRYAAPDLRSMIEQQKADPWLVHYAGDEKPWESRAPWRAQDWWSSAARTGIAWPAPAPAARPALHRVHMRLRKWIQRTSGQMPGSGTRSENG